MKKLLFILCLVANLMPLIAQNRVHLRQSGRDSFYTSLEAAYNRAQDGDTIYLPGGSFSFLGDSVAKRLHIVGAGTHIDSSRATNMTMIRSMILTSKASGGSITGIHIGESTYPFSTPLIVGRVDNDNTNVNSYSIIKCNLRAGIKYRNGVSASNFLINGCIIGNIGDPGDCPSTVSISKGNNFFLVNNVIAGRVILSNSEINGNIFNHFSPYSCNLSFTSELNCIVKNNIFRSWQVSTSYSCARAFWANNYNCPCNGVFENSGQGIGNFSGTIQHDSLFVNSARQDYHLRPAYRTTYIGTDGTQIGIYGGRFPWKDGSMPYNPWIKTFNAAPQTDNNGRLRLQAEIKSQKD